MFIIVYSSFIILNYGFLYSLNLCIEFMYLLLPARASEQGNVIGSVSVYIYIYIYIYIYVIKKKL